jgi:hypothetical protein
LYKIVEGPLPPFECSIILRDLAILVEDVPGLDFDRDDEVAEEGKGEVESVQRPLSAVFK